MLQLQDSSFICIYYYSIYVFFCILTQRLSYIPERTFDGVIFQIYRAEDLSRVQEDFTSSLRRYRMSKAEILI